MTTQTQTKPAEGNCRWLDIDPVTGNRYLQIDVLTESGWVRQDYEVEEVCEPFKLPVYRLYSLHRKTREIVCYTVTSAHSSKRWTCDCGDATNRRQGQCKHVLSIQKAIPQKTKGLIR